MNLALPALAIVVLLSPGLIFTWAIREWLDLSFEQSELLKSLLVVVIASVVLHVAGGVGCACLGLPISYRAVLALLQGGPDRELGWAMDMAASSLGRVTLYFFSLWVLASIVGFLSNRFLFRFRPDLRPNWSGVCQLSNEWYYFLSGDYTRLPKTKWDTSRTPDIIRISTVITVGQETYLYCGLLTDFYFDRGGKLDRLVLASAKRRRMRDDRSPDQEHHPDGDDRYYPIIGHLFVIKYNEVSTLNFQYAWLEETEEEASSNRDRSPASDV